MLQTNEVFAIPLGGPVDPERLRTVARMGDWTFNEQLVLKDTGKYT